MADQRTIHAFFLTEHNEFQAMQAKTAKAAAEERGFRIETCFAENNALAQIDQLFASIHAKKGPAPDAIIVEPVAGEGLPRVARNAVGSGIAWTVLNSDAPYMAALRSEHPEVPAFAVCVDNYEIGRLQAAQLRQLLSQRDEASVLCVQGPPAAAPAVKRAAGLRDALGENGYDLTILDAQWTEYSAHQAVSKWLQLHASARIDVLLAHNDEMATGARQAMTEQLGSSTTREMGFLGCDGLESYGRSLVREGQLSATLVTALPSLGAVKRLAKALAGDGMPPEEVLLAPESFPALGELAPL